MWFRAWCRHTMYHLPSLLQPQLLARRLPRGRQNFRPLMLASVGMNSCSLGDASIFCTVETRSAHPVVCSKMARKGSPTRRQ